MEMKEVDKARYLERLSANRENLYRLSLNAWQVPLLHGLITLAAEHPDVMKLGGYTQDLIQEVRRWCRHTFAQMGFTPEEVEYLDQKREALAAGREANAEKDSP